MSTTTGASRDDLAGICDVRRATAADAVDGVVPELVAFPRSTEEVSAVLAAAHDRGMHVVPRGAGTRLSWGGVPAAVDLVLDVSRLDGVCNHAAGDLVVTVSAGVAFAALQEALAPHGQRLALDPVVGGGTIGGAVATGVSGPLRYRYGAVRDLLIGITVVRADGTVTHAGGVVVKNVAGYDLGKLYTGSMGTLGVITEATFRLHPLPEAARWVTVTTPDPQRAAAAVAAVRSSQNDPVALEVDRPGPGEPTTVGVAVEGIAQGIGARCDDVSRLLGEATGASASVDESPPDWWGRLPHDVVAGPGATLTLEPAALGEVLAAAPGAVRGSAGAGVLAVGLDAGFDAGFDAGRVAGDLDALRTLAARHGGSAVLRCATPDVKQACDVWGPVPALPLMRRVKDEFDPEHRLAPGRFVGGI